MLVGLRMSLVAKRSSLFQCSAMQWLEPVCFVLKHAPPRLTRRVCTRAAARDHLHWPWADCRRLRRVVCVQHQLQEKAHEFEHEKSEEIRVGLVNIISDSVTITAFLLTLAMHVEGRTALVNTIGRISQGMSQTGKAFILILAADVLMGYHSEEGWTAGIELLSEHYMVEVGVRPPLRPPAVELRSALTCVCMRQSASFPALTLALFSTG